MQPDNQPSPKPLYVPPRQSAPSLSARPDTSSQDAAADLARTQISSIYSSDPHANMPAQSAQPVAAAPEPATPSAPTSQPTATTPTPTISRSFTPESDNPYRRNHDETKLEVDKAAWQQYHSAWQSYYQQYFHRYYAGHIQESQAKIVEQTAHIQQLQTRPVEQSSEETLTDLRSQIRHKVQQTAGNVRRSRHFVPIVAASIVMLVFAFLQYNAVLFANVEAYVSPASTEPTNMIVSPSSTVAVDNNPRLIIPKIAVDVPIIWNATPDYDSQMAAMKNGVAWFNIKGANARPGQIGNTVLSGHSSNDVFDDGKYKFVFARLEQVAKGDTLYINYEGVRYTYTVTQRRVVKPTQVSALTEPTDKPIVTLITCTPLGTATNRLLVTAEQISPNPNGAKKATESSSSSDAAMPGNAPTFFERLFGSR